MDKDLLFFIMAFACLWLVLDELYGNKLISQFVIMLIPKAEK